MCLKYAPAKPSPSSPSKMLPIMPYCKSETWNGEFSDFCSRSHVLQEFLPLLLFVLRVSLSWGPGLSLPLFHNIMGRRQGPSQRRLDDNGPPKEIFTWKMVHHARYYKGPKWKFFLNFNSQKLYHCRGKCYGAKRNSFSFVLFYFWFFLLQPASSPGFLVQSARLWWMKIVAA